MPTTTKTSSVVAANAAATTAQASTDSYAAAYAQLSAIADKLRTAAGAAGVDSLLADVRTARRLHHQLRNRLDAVRRELEAEADADVDVERARQEGEVA